MKEEFLNEIGLSQDKLAEAIVSGTRDVTADTDLRLCKFFGLSEGYFLRLQNAYDTLEAKRRISLPADVAKIRPYRRQGEAA